MAGGKGRAGQDGEEQGREGEGREGQGRERKAGQGRRGKGREVRGSYESLSIYRACQQGAAIPHDFCP